MKQVLPLKPGAINSLAYAGADVAYSVFMRS